MERGEQQRRALAFAPSVRTGPVALGEALVRMGRDLVEDGYSEASREEAPEHLAQPAAVEGAHEQAERGRAEHDAGREAEQGVEEARPGAGNGEQGQAFEPRAGPGGQDPEDRPDVHSD